MDKRQLDKKIILSVLEKKVLEFKDPKKGENPPYTFKIFPSYDFFSYKPFPSDSVDPPTSLPHSMLSNTSIDYIRELLFEIELESKDRFKITDPSLEVDIVPNNTYSPGRARILPFGGAYIMTFNPTVPNNESNLSLLNKQNEKKTKLSNKKGGKIEEIEILKNNNGRVKLYINNNYNGDLSFSRGKLWGKMYELAENGNVNFDKRFFDYFNSSSKNPLYGNKYGFNMTKILKQEDGTIIPNIKISLITQKRITQELKSA